MRLQAAALAAKPVQDVTTSVSSANGQQSLYNLQQSAGVAGNPLLKTPLQNAQAAQAQALQSAQVQAQALQAANQGLLNAAAHQQQGQYSALTAAAANRAAAVAGMPGLALQQGFGREYADPYLGHSIGPVPNYGAAMYRGFNRFTPY
uniref:CSON014456 protein n=1 Tax=Culicoides sonorensis TaxID=179676 RepID=A0A336MEX4_CULSO